MLPNHHGLAIHEKVDVDPRSSVAVPAHDPKVTPASPVEAGRMPEAQDHLITLSTRN